MISAINNQSVD